METIFTSQAPAPGGHYAQAILHQGLVYISGQLPVNPETGTREIGTALQPDNPLRTGDAVHTFRLFGPPGLINRPDRPVPDPLAKQPDVLRRMPLIAQLRRDFGLTRGGRNSS